MDSNVDIVTFVDEGLGHVSYLVDFGNGEALVVDAPRIPAAHLDLAARRGLEVAWAADTHSHADYVSGGPELAARGATLLAPAAANLLSPHRGVVGCEEIRLGEGVTLRAIATPGHTPDHLSYLLIQRGSPVALFSGGSLMVGAVGRTDLLGPEHREHLARLMFRSLRADILTLPDGLPVFPTHGAGSFCSAGASSETSTTIGRERATNPMLAIDDEDTFVTCLLGELGSFPSYYRDLPELNRRGARLYGELPRLARLDIETARRHIEAGAALIDARPITAFSALHAAGAISMQLRPVFATWLGWLLDAHRPLVFLLDEDQDRADLVRQCLDVGRENLVGEIDGGVEAWIAAGLPTAHIPLVTASELAGTVIDVRQGNEWAAGHLPGATHVELADLSTFDVAEGPLTIMCGHGERAMTGASILAARGRRGVRVLSGGPADWATHTGQPLTVT
jgi:hydroxyacylglutathione hydrolase